MSDIDYRPGDVVWAIDSLTWAKRRGEVVDGPPYRIAFNDGTHAYYPRHRLRPYSAIDQLADLITCATCRQRPADCNCIKFTTANCTSSASTITYSIGETALNADPVSQSDDELALAPERRTLSDRERLHRQRRTRMAKMSRRRNR